MAQSRPAREFLTLSLLGLLSIGGCGEGRNALPTGPEETLAISDDSSEPAPRPRRPPIRRWGYVAPDVPFVPEGPAVPGEAIITLPLDGDIERFNFRWGTTTIRGIEGSTATLVATPAGVSVADLATEMITYGECDWAEPNYLSESPENRQGTIPFYEGDHVFDDVADQDALLRIGAPTAHLTATGAGVVVAVLDTGIDNTHPDLAASVSTIGWDFIDEDAAPLDERNDLDDDGDGDVDEGAGHGTHVAGLVLAAAPGVTLLPVRVLDSDGMGTTVGVARGIRWAVENGADVINLSLGMYVDARAIKDAIDLAKDLGVIVVNSAGNKGTQDSDHFPARLSPVVSVAASDPLDSWATFSNFGSHVDIAAPGVGLLSTFLDQGYAVWSGTSMSAPLVAGCAALRLQIVPLTTTSSFREDMAETAAPLTNEEGSIWEGKLGDGRIDAAALVLH